VSHSYVLPILVSIGGNVIAAGLMLLVVRGAGRGRLSAQV
jgi:hypothetical protein